MLESKQERIAALERQVEDLMQDRKFLRTQIENLTSSRSIQAFAPPTCEGLCLFAPALAFRVHKVAHFPPTISFSVALAQLRSPARRSTRRANHGKESECHAAHPTAARAAPRLRTLQRFRLPRVNTGGRSTTKRRNDRRRRRTTAGREVAVTLLVASLSLKLCSKGLVGGACYLSLLRISELVAEKSFWSKLREQQQLAC